MAKLYDATDNLLTKAVQVQPVKNPIKIEQTLLDGSLDVQIIGDYEQIFEVQFVITYAYMIILQEAAATGTSIKLEHEGTTYTCYIRGIPDFRLANIGVAANRYYEGRMTLSDIT